MKHNTAVIELMMRGAQLLSVFKPAFINGKFNLGSEINISCDVSQSADGLTHTCYLKLSMHCFAPYICAKIWAQGHKCHYHPCSLLMWQGGDPVGTGRCVCVWMHLRKLVCVLCSMCCSLRKWFFISVWARAGVRGWPSPLWRCRADPVEGRERHNLLLQMNVISVRALNADV